MNTYKNYQIENNQIIISIDGKNYLFPAYAEAPRSSLLGLGISVGGSHLSSRDPNIKIEKHTSIQEVKVGDNYVAWYTQEFIPDGIDYKVTKNAHIYLGNLNTNKHKLIYKGECYGDLYFYENELFFNTGNKIAVYNIDKDEINILFKHSGIKKNALRLHVTKQRIYYTHWTHSKAYFMWFDRQTQKLINPHIDTYQIYYIDDNTILFGGTSLAWILDANTCKKTQLFSKKKSIEICTNIYKLLNIPLNSCELGMDLHLDNYDGERLYFLGSPYYIKINEDVALQMGYPPKKSVWFSCLIDGSDIRIEKKEK